MRVSLFLFLFAIFFSNAGRCQEGGVAFSYQATDNRFDQMFCAVGFGEIDLSNRWSFRGNGSYNIYYYKEVRERQGANGPTVSSINAKGTASVALGVGLFYSLVKGENHFELQIGVSGGAHAYAPNAVLNWWERFYRPELEFPIILKYRQIADSKFGTHLSFAPGRIFRSDKHIQFEADLGKTINKLRFEIGVFYDLQ
ncbi:hypothetical protein [Halocola ammonii]